MSKNVVRKANKTIIDKILHQIQVEIDAAVYFRNKNDSDNVSYFLHMVYELRQTEFKLYQLSVFNNAEHEYFTWGFVEMLTNNGFSVRQIWNEKNEKE